jgi:hypothetical protein
VRGVLTQKKVSKEQEEAEKRARRAELEKMKESESLQLMD